MYSIQVVNITHHTDCEYCGRPSPLGNPFPMSKHHSRNYVCDRYETWFQDKINCNDQLVLFELIRLHNLGKENSVLKLGCYCKPKRCHVDTIKQWMESNFEVLEELAYTRNN